MICLILYFQLKETAIFELLYNLTVIKPVSTKLEGEKERQNDWPTSNLLIHFPNVHNSGVELG